MTYSPTPKSTFTPTKQVKTGLNFFKNKKLKCNFFETCLFFKFTILKMLLIFKNLHLLMVCNYIKCSRVALFWLMLDVRSHSVTLGLRSNQGLSIDFQPASKYQIPDFSFHNKMIAFSTIARVEFLKLKMFRRIRFHHPSKMCFRLLRQSQWSPPNHRLQLHHLNPLNLRHLPGMGFRMGFLNLLPALR